MNYDRLMQLGGIDREVPPIPGYITKDQLQGEIDNIDNWKEEQETPIPDNVIKGIKEIENFLAGNQDTETLTAVLQALTNTLQQYTDNKIAAVIDTMEIDENSGDVTVEYDDGTPTPANVES